MAKTFINYNENNGFYIGESFIQLAMYYIYTEALKPQYVFSNKANVLLDMKYKIDGIQSTYFTLMWSSLLNGSSDEQSMIAVLQNTRINLQNKGAYIAISELQALDSDDFDFKYFFGKNFPTSELIKIIDALIQIMQGTWTSTNYDMNIDYKY